MTESTFQETGPPSSIQRNRLGPYDLLSPLASGAMGVVYRARHADTGQGVALKTLHAVQPSVLEGLRREAHALSRLRHPEIVRLLDSGVDGGLPWYAMELIEGGTLRDLWEGDGPTGAPPKRGGRTRELVDRCLRLIREVCSPLAYLHGEGIVHRDLKPENIVLRRGSDQPIIVDFGLIGHWNAVRAREALTAGGELIGTADYIAPEQIRGEYVDARADLYSLGCILYETVVGSPPFRGAPGEILYRHLEERPTPPSRYVADLDPRLENLILRLLEKRPAGRIGFAEDVAFVLGEVLGVAPKPAGKIARSYLYRPSFVGRERTKATLERALERTEGGHGGLVLVGGESGSGKTRFAMEITREATARGFQVITGECVAAESTEAAAQVRGAPLQPLQPLLREVADRCMSEGSESTARFLGKRAKILSKYEPAIRAVPGYDDQPAPAVLPTGAERARVLGDVADVLTLLSEEAPVLLVLDDLQWADEMTLALLETFRETFFERARVLVLGCFRADEVSAELQNLLSAPHHERVDMDRFDRAAVEEMVSNMLAMEPPPRRLVHLLSRDSEGNPFFVAEYVRAAVEEGFLQHIAAEGWQLGEGDRTDDPLYASLPLPRSLRELVARRLTDLDDSSLSFVEAGAVLGREFPLDLARELAGQDEVTAMESVRQLIQRQVLEDAGGRLRFAHDKLREAAYARIDRRRSIELHHLAAAGIEAVNRSEESLTAHYAELAHHWEMADVMERAFQYMGLAAERALATGAYKDAHLILTRALRLDEQKGGESNSFRRAHWHRMLGVASFGIGDLDGSIHSSAEALEGLDERMPRTTPGWLLVATQELLRFVLRRRGQPTAAARDRVMYEVAQACGQLATSYFYNADVIPAAANLLRGLNRARRAGDEATVVQSCARLGYVSGAIGLDRVAHSMFERARATAGRTDNESGRALALYLEAMYQQFLGNWEGCRQLAREAAAILERIGDQSEAETARAIESHGLFFAGRFQQAKDCSASILHAAEERSNKHHVGWGLYLMARCEVALGDLDEAITKLDRARILLEPLPDAIDIVICEGWLARALLFSGRVDAALDVATELGKRLSNGRRPAVGQCVDGYAGWAEISLAVWGSTGSERAAFSTQRACAELRRFARIFRMAQPAAQRCTAEMRWIQGRRSAAIRGLQNSLQSARALAMPYEEASSLAALARLAECSEERNARRIESRALLESLGCPEPSAWR